MNEAYLWLKALHLIAVIAWMAGMLYLPRLFVYHAAAKPGSEMSETFKIMEHRLLRYIMTPAMLIAFVLGIMLLVQNPDLMREPSLHLKFGLVLVMAALHGYFAVCTKKFARDENRHSPRFYRILNEAPTLLLIAIVILIIVKPL
jgi:putative membrane protein